MNSYIVEGKVGHARAATERHAFEYSVYFFDLDVDELKKISSKISFFSLNRWNILSLYEQNYLDPGNDNLRNKVESLLKRRGIAAKPASIRLVTQLRYFGWVFNPVSFFFCYDGGGKMISVVADVNNTFGEGHAYLLSDFRLLRPDCYEAREPKAFHVSPFFSRDGEYRFEFDFSKKDAVNIVLDYYREGSLQLASSWKGTRRPFEPREILSVLCRYPFGGWLTIFRIHFQAVILHFVKRLPIFSKPDPDSDMTIRHRKQNQNAR